MAESQPNLCIYHGEKQHNIFVESGSEIKLIDVLKHYTLLDNVKFIHLQQKTDQGRHLNYFQYTINDLKAKPNEFKILENNYWTVVIMNPETKIENAVVSYKLEFHY